MEGVVQHDMVDDGLSSNDNDVVAQEMFVKEGADASDIAMEGSADGGHHHHHPVENQLRWAPDSKYCMSVDKNAFANGQKMQIWECKAGMGQYFSYTPGHHTLLRSAAARAFCVVIDGNSFHNGAKVQLWECDPSERAQHWILAGHGWRGVMIKNAAYPSKCLVVNGNAGYNGNKLQLWDCRGSEQFKLWTPAHDR